MNFYDKHIVESYSDLLKGLSDDNKKELIENLTKSLKSNSESIELAFYKSFGAFGSEKSPDNIIDEIKSDRKFKKNKIQF